LADLSLRLAALAHKAGSNLSPFEFYHVVQTAYHDVESEYYDDLHSEMYFYLENIFNRLFSLASKEKVCLRILDIGAGTGLVETFLAKKHSAILEQIDVVEPNARMIHKLEQKNLAWKLPIVSKNSYLENAGLNQEYDIAICSSVLHHIPDLSTFFSLLRNLVKPGGFILTMQDPRSEVLNDKVATDRRSMFLLQNQVVKKVQRSKIAALKHAAESILRSAGVNKFLSKNALLEKKVNRLLKDKKIINVHLSIQEIWAIADIHVPGLPGSIGSGISLDQLRRWLPNFEKSAYITYNFFNTNMLELNGNFLSMENKFLSEDDGHGFLFASLFRNK
jgi:2-polyprenyl-3-methyl-5-hydroxy-6-metoxy-1,4-benzoquinol methylase